MELFPRTAPEIGDALKQVEESPLIQQEEPAVNVREIRRTYDRAVKVPKALVEELARVTTRAQQVWQKARRDKDFAAFQPWLEKVVYLKQQEAQAVGYREAPYDALLDEYEPGATASEITQVFAELRAELVQKMDGLDIELYNKLFDTTSVK